MTPIASTMTQPTKPERPSAALPHAAEPATGVGVKDRPAPARPRLDRLPPFRVLLHNDDVNEVPYVVETVQELTPLSRPQALVATLEADHTGVALLLVTHKERAELYRDQFESRFLTVTIEPAE